MAVAAMLVTTGCGINKKPHWNNKNFGQLESENPENLPVAETPSDERETPSDPEETYDKVLSHYGFSGYFQMETVRRILRGTDEINGEVSSGGFLDDMLGNLLSLVIGEEHRETLTMLVKQNGKGRNRVQQLAITEGGDRIAAVKGDESQSGVQYLDWVLPGSELSKSCPRTFICIDRMVWSPSSGKDRTYCYRDSKTRERIAIPYSANPHFSKDAYSDAIGNGRRSDPIDVVVLKGNTACDNKDAVTLDIERVVYDIKLGNLSGVRNPDFLKKAIHKPLIPDNEVIVDYHLYHSEFRQPYLPKKGPYIDQRTRLSPRMRFFTSSQEHVIVKIERTIQSPLKLEGSQITEFIRQAYGDTAAYLVGLIFPADGDTEGAQLRYSFEFCTHLSVVEKPFNHCMGR